MKNSITGSDHMITLEKARKMIAHFHEKKEHLLHENFKGVQVLNHCETFDRAAFDRLLAVPGCIGVRIHYGLDEDHKMHAIIVGVDENDNDMLPNLAEDGVMQADSGDGPVIVEDGKTCPPYCTSTSLQP
ncbi:MAG TPA: hypothetical protein VNS32_09655 [Flavisolibacter sp.]|nr:hypothetical protein [Flavisolibacter sp.]